MNKWEYKIVVIAGTAEHVESWFNMLGSEGWEAIMESSTGCRFTFKREIQEHNCN